MPSDIRSVEEDRRRAAIAFRNSIDYASSAIFAKDKRELVLDLAVRWNRSEAGFTDEQMFLKLREVAMEGHDTHAQKLRAVNEAYRQLTVDLRPDRALPAVVEDAPQGWCEELGRMLTPAEWADRFDAQADEFESRRKLVFTNLARICRERAASLRERGFDPNPERNLAWLKKLSAASRRAGLTADAE